MYVNHVNLSTGENIIDLRGSTIAEDNLFEGVTALNSEGKPIMGTFPNSEIDIQSALIEQINNALNGKAGGEVVEPIIEPLEITENGTYTAPDGVDGYSPVSVNVPIPDGYIIPSGTLEVTENGTFDVTDKASVNVNVEGGGGGGGEMAGALADKSITEFISDNCASLGEYSFRVCKNLRTLIAPNAKSVGTYALYRCSALKSLTLPSVTSIATNAFRELTNAEVIDLPKLTEIPTNAFYGCHGLKALILRSNTMVTLANTSAFYQCYCILGTKNSGYNPDGEKIGFIYVPANLIDEYRSATNWSSDSLVTQLRAIEDYPDICGG